MQTKILSDMAEAAEIIKRGGLVAVPTETVYGLAANAMSEAAVQRIFEVKGRPENKPLSILVGDASAVGQYSVNAPKAAYSLAERFWPGPLTIVLRSVPEIPAVVRAGGETIGLRCPDHPLTLELLRLTGTPLAAPSANPSGSPSPKTAAEVLAYFDGMIDGVIDGGECGFGFESTIIDMSRIPYDILRRGALDESEVFSAITDTLKVIGITGGTGGGKTTALQILGDMGALTLDCDVIYHELLERSGDMLAEIGARFPGVVENGVIQRKRLGEIVFADENALSDLNAITHKYVTMEVEARLGDWARQGNKIAAIDAIALIESGIAERCDAVVGVVAGREARIQRVMDREGISKEYAERRIGAQKPDSFFIEHCSHILYNNGDFAAFRNSCRELFEKIIIE